MNIWLISIFENTPIDDNLDTRYNAIVREALDRGYKITFWASTFKHSIKKQRYPDTKEIEIQENLKLIFLKSRAYKANISYQRLHSHYQFGSDLVKTFEKQGEQPDVILMAFPPISIAHDVTIWAKKNNIPCIMDIIDPWPTVIKTHFTKRSVSIFDILLYPMDNKVRKTLKRISAVISISNQYLEWAKGYQPSTKVFQCFYPAIDFKKMHDKILAFKKNIAKDHPFTVIYAGSLGHYYDIPTILSAAETLGEKYGDKIQFIIAGDGPQKNLIEAYQKKHANLKYLGRIPKEDLLQEYAKANVGLTQHVKGATQSVTYKLFDLLGAGLPVLNSLESEMKDIILSNKVGLHNTPENAIALAKNIEYCYQHPDELKQMSKRGITLTQKEGDAKVVYQKLVNFIESVSQKADFSQLEGIQ